MSKKYPSFYEKLQQATNEDKQVNEIYKHTDRLEQQEKVIEVIRNRTERQRERWERHQ